jgi:hypothetical protein
MEFLKVIRIIGMGHETVVHSAKEFVRGKVHSNTADGIGSMLEWARMGVWHRMSRRHLQLYLDEIGFRWNCRRSRNDGFRALPSSLPILPRLLWAMEVTRRAQPDSEYKAVLAAR